MAFSYSSNATNFVKQFQQIIDHARQCAGDEERRLITLLTEKILARTPVWEGDSIANYIWSVDAPTLTHINPIASGPTGHTNKMALGQEPRRAANEALVRESLARILTANLPADVYLTNSAPDIVNLEYGNNPTKQTSRVSAAGMVRLAIIDAMGSIRGQ